MNRNQSSRHQRGQSMVEFALIVPLLAVVVFGIVEFGNLIRVQIELQNAVRDGVRYAAINYADASLSTHVKTANPGGVQTAAPDLTPLTVAVSYPTACPSSTAVVQVTATYSYSAITPVGTLFPLFHGTFANPDTLTATAKLHSEC